MKTLVSCLFLAIAADETRANVAPVDLALGALQAYVKVGNTGAGDRFGYSIAVSGDTAVVGAYSEDSSTTGVNSTPDEDATDSRAAYALPHAVRGDLQDRRRFHRGLQLERERLPPAERGGVGEGGGLAGQRFPWGDTITQNLANYDGNTTSYSYDLGPDGYNVLGNDGTAPYTTPVGTFAPNGYGLHDMAGNVLEWCWDWYQMTYAGGSNPHGPSSDSSRVCRGGNWDSYAVHCRVANRYSSYPSSSYSDSFGFRIARSSVP